MMRGLKNNAFERLTPVTEKEEKQTSMRTLLKDEDLCPSPGRCFRGKNILKNQSIG